MTLTFGDVCLFALALATWLIFLFGINVAG